jgi:hypothetical protein
MSSPFGKFIKEALFYYDQRTFIRWFIFTYPKTTGSLFLASLAALNFFTINSTQNEKSMYIAIHEAIHSNEKNLKPNNKIVIYGSNSSE